MTTPVVTPDVEAILTKLLRTDPAVAAVVGDRVYSDLPHKREYPMVVVTRTGGGFVFSRPQYLEAAEVTLDIYGGTHRDAQRLWGLCLDALQRLVVARHDDGAVTRLSVRSTAYQPEPDSVDSQGHGRPRFVAEIVVYVHP